MSPSPAALTREIPRNVYLFYRSIQLNQIVSRVPVHRFPSSLRPHLAFQAELWVDDDDQKHRVAFGRYPSEGMNLESQIPMGITTWSYMSVVSEAIDIIHRGLPYLTNGDLHFWAKHRQSFAEELGHTITTSAFKRPDLCLRTETTQSGVFELDCRLHSPFLHAKPHWAEQDRTVGARGMAVLSGGPGRSKPVM
ncbi:hypothetical protein C8R47DRAFT_1133567 [Mycena vitilis]|nr:hypothetical protein C8R47DRAFT_1133567 [Mycena vitilis]